MKTSHATMEGSVKIMDTELADGEEDDGGGGGGGRMPGWMQHGGMFDPDDARFCHPKPTSPPLLPHTCPREHFPHPTCQNSADR